MFNGVIDWITKSQDPKANMHIALLHKLIVVLARGYVNTARTLREVQAAVDIDCWKVDADVPFVKPLKERYQDYLTAVRRKRPNHDLGGPSPIQSIALLEVILDQPGPIAGDDLEKLRKYRVGLDSITIEQVMDECPIIKLQKAFSQKGKGRKLKFKITCHAPKGIRGLLATWLTATSKCRKLQGVPAPVVAGSQATKLLKAIHELKYCDDISQCEQSWEVASS